MAESKPSRATIRVTRAQIELAQAKLEVDRMLKRSPDPLLAKIAAAAPPASAKRLAG